MSKAQIQVKTIFRKCIQCPDCKNKTIVSDRTVRVSCYCGLIWYGYDQQWHDTLAEQGIFA